jgi:bis(5'-nucleosyl)-tetraphosphatase (symmetrical)
MATYAIGDIQGCYRSLQALLAKLRFRKETDRLLLVGDLVNRGPGSLEVLRWALEQGAAVEAVLGNHDLHLLAVASGAADVKGKDTLDPILEAPDAEALLGWLRARRLLYVEDGVAIAHAGLYPGWSLPMAERLSAEVSAELMGGRAKDFFKHMYGGEPRAWRDDLTGYDRLRFITNVFTRMRMLHKSGEVEFRWKGGVKNVPADLLPWYDAPHAPRGVTVIFGHWSALGLLVRDDVVGLDTGCVWGGTLTALRLEDRKIFQVEALDGALPIDE